MTHETRDHISFPQHLQTPAAPAITKPILNCCCCFVVVVCLFAQVAVAFLLSQRWPQTKINTKHFAFSPSLKHITLPDIHPPFPGKLPEFHTHLGHQGSLVFLPDLATAYNLCDCSKSRWVLKAEEQLGGNICSWTKHPVHPTDCLLSIDPPVNLINVISTSNPYFGLWTLSMTFMKFCISHC